MEEKNQPKNFNKFIYSLIFLIASGLVLYFIAKRKHALNDFVMMKENLPATENSPSIKKEFSFPRKYNSERNSSAFATKMASNNNSDTTGSTITVPHDEYENRIEEALLAMEQDPQEGSLLLKKVLEINPDDDFVLETLVYHYLEFEPDQGLSFFEEWEKKNPSAPNTSRLYGVLLAEAHQYEKAISQLEKAIAISNNPSDAMASLAMTYSKMGQFDKAVSMYQDAVQEAKQEEERKEQGHAKTTDLYTKSDLYKAELIDLLISQGRKEEADKLLKQL